MNMYTLANAARLAEAKGEEVGEIDYEPWAEPADDDVRRARGEAAYAEIHGVPAAPSETAFRGRAYVDFMYGEVWTRDRYLTRRDRRIISICCCGSEGVDEETREHLRAAMATGDMTYEELQELVFHFAVYMGWPLGRRMDDLLIGAATELGERDA
jgi:4-carboxymuconolactone decarboxylase